jgi:hypothetical protein
MKVPVQPVKSVMLWSHSGHLVDTLTLENKSDNIQFLYGKDFSCKAKELMSLLSITIAPNVIVLDAHRDFNDNIHYEEI